MLGCVACVTNYGGSRRPEDLLAAFFVVKFATAVEELEELPHLADYDPEFSTVDEVRVRIAEARQAAYLFRNGATLSESLLDVTAL
jgi:hypothetical protein